MGPQLMNCCRPAQMDAEGRVSAKESTNWRIEGEKKRIRLVEPGSRKAEPLRCKQKTMVGKSGERRCEARKWEKRVVQPWVSRSQGKSSAVRQQHATDYSASAKHVVGQRGRRSLGTEGRKAMAKDCFREPGQGDAEIP